MFYLMSKHATVRSSSSSLLYEFLLSFRILNGILDELLVGLILFYNKNDNLISMSRYLVVQLMGDTN